MFDGFEGRLYHEVLLVHQRSENSLATRCICGWTITVGIDTYMQHLATKINDWVEANFIFIDKV